MTNINAGQLTAIVGLSGSGKSTIASLITRFYDPESGDVLLDGKNVKDINIRNLRGFISLVQQEPSLLDRSILENIALGLVNSPPHSHLEQTLLSGTLTEVAEQVRTGQDLLKVAESLGPEVVEIVNLVQHAADLADVAIFIDRLEFGFATLVGSSGSLVRIVSLDNAIFTSFVLTEFPPGERWSKAADSTCTCPSPGSQSSYS